MAKHVPSLHAQQIGARLVAGREALGLSQADLARLLGITVQKLNNWEKGRNAVPPEWYPPIYRVTRLNADYLLLDDPTRLPNDILQKLVRSRKAG